jgi:hypothetical protein
MLDPIVNFFSRIFFLIGRTIGLVIAWILWPFLKVASWYRSTGFLWQAIVGLILLALAAGYGWFIYAATFTRGFDPDYVASSNWDKRGISAGEEVTAAGAGTTTKTCGRSAIADVVISLTDFNVNQNNWVSSMLLYKMGLFGLDWDSTPWLDNKASFQRGVLRATQRTAVEMADALGRVRGTSEIDPDLTKARGFLQYDEYSWYFGLSPFGARQSSPASFRAGAAELKKFNDRLEKCEATFDARADNLSDLVDKIASDIGSTSAALDDRSQNNDMGWFDTQADNQFWFAYGQLYAYYGIVSAAHADFEDVIRTKSVDVLWNKMEGQIRTALDLDPLVVSNGAEDGWIMPTHLTTMGFKILRVRSNLVEVRSVLQQ